MAPSEDFATVWIHLASLRKTVFNSLIVICLGTIAAFCFYQQLFSWITYPIHHSSTLLQQEVKYKRIFNTSHEDQLYPLPPQSTLVEASVDIKEITPGIFLLPPDNSLEIKQIISSNQLILLGPLDGISTSLKVSIWVGLVVTAPLWMFFFLKFISPALHPGENNLIFPFLLLSCIFMTLGVLFAFFITIPLANQYLHTFNSSIGNNLWTVGNYLDYTLTLLVANALSFELFVILLFLVHFGIITAVQMKQKRRHMIVAAFIIGAVLTPPDILTQFLLAVPLIGLYELTILYAAVTSHARELNHSYHDHQ